MSLGTIAKVWTFGSKSNPSKTHETLQYTDGSTSCGCSGWCKRVAADGSRTCRHTRLVDQGLADSEAVSFKDYEGKGEIAAKLVMDKKGSKGTTKPKSKKMEEESTDPMDKDLKDLDKNWESKRKIRWK